MNTTNYKQYDTRWAKLPYKDNPDNIGNNGCGEVAVCNSIIEMTSQMNQTPATMQPYCRQYACHDGTYWSGIPAMLKHYGCTEVMEHQNMASLWNELAKGNRVAIYMMNNRPAGYKGIHWTSGGHFICSTAYKYENGEHCVYVKDSNSSSNERNGWMSYESSLRGDVSACWSGKLNGSPAPTPTPTPTGKLVVDGVGGYETVKRLQEFLKLSGPDGLIGRQRKSMVSKYVPSLTAVSYSMSGGSNTVTALQKWLGLSDPDGLWGKNTSGALQRRLRDYGYLAADESIDEIFGPKSMKALQTALNNDFKKKTDPPTPPTPTPTTYTNVIDVSVHQDSINWSQVKASGIVGAMVRCGYRGYETAKLNEDKMFLNHIKGASTAGLKVGVYFFTEAINYAEGREEAEFTLKLIEKAGVNLYYPIAVDTEYIGEDDEGIIPRADNISKTARTDAIKGFCDVIKERGGQPMIYASTNWFENKLDMSKLPYDCWCAQYYKECEYKGKVVMWQYTSEGMVSGVQGVVDMNNCYITSPAPMPKPTPQPTPDPKPYSGAYPTDAEIREASYKGIHNNIVSWDKDIADSGKYHYVSFSDDEYTHECPICTKRTYDLGWNCIGYAFASWRHGGGIPCTCNCGVIWNGLGDRYINMSDAEVLASMKQRIGVNDIKLIRNGNKSIPASSLEKGDLLMYYNGNEYAHMAVYIGNGKISDDTSGDGVRYGVSYSIMKCLFAIRYTGTRSYMKKGDEGKAVLEWQDYLNWWSDGQFYKECGAGDTYFGSNTHKWTVKFQTAVFGASEADGTVGQKTITAAKNVRK